MEIYKTKTFYQWQKKESLKDSALIKAIEEIKLGLVDAKLGNNVFKKRVAKPGFGKRSSYRTILASNLNNKWFFMFGFAKNERDNVDSHELEALKAFADVLLEAEKVQIKELIAYGTLRKIDYEKE
jgi:hypothetical protein